MENVATIVIFISLLYVVYELILTFNMFSGKVIGTSSTGSTGKKKGTVSIVGKHIYIDDILVHTIEEGYETISIIDSEIKIDGELINVNA